MAASRRGTSTTEKFKHPPKITYCCRCGCCIGLSSSPVPNTGGSLRSKAVVNVLLDNDFTAHVSDFGLAQLLCKFSNEATMNQFSSLGIKGTIGYAAPGNFFGQSHFGTIYLILFCLVAITRRDFPILQTLFEHCF